MIISFTCNNLNNGGAERVICNWANQMARDGHQVRIICYAVLDSFYFTLDSNVKIIELDKDVNARNSFLSRKMAGLRNFARLFKAIKGSDRVISFYTRQNCYSIIASRIQGIPIVCAERDHFFLSDGSVNHILRRILYPFANGFIHQTEMAREWLRKNEGVKCRDIVIPNPLWINDFPKRNPIPGRIVAVGRLAEQKNYEGMIEAFCLVHEKKPEAELHIYGDGPLRDGLNNMIHEKGLDGYVILEGITQNVVEVYSKSELFVMFSHGEGYPNALMEALAMGVPSISSDCPVGGPRDMIKDGVNGFLVACGDVESLSEKILELLSNERLRERFSEKAIQIRETNKFEAMYSKMIKYVLEIK